MAKTKTGKAIKNYINETIDYLDGNGIVATDGDLISEALNEQGEFESLQEIVLKDKKVLSDKQLKCLKKVINYDIADEAQDFENYVHDTYGSDEGHKFAELNREQRIKYIEDAKDIHHVYYSLLVLQDLL